MVRSARRVTLVGTVLVALAAGAAFVMFTRDGENGEPARAAKLRDQRFRSRPDLSPPGMRVTALSPGIAPGKVFMAPKRRSGQGGPAILDERGRLVWFKPMPKGIVADDFRVQRYDGKPVLTWWEGKTNDRGQGQGLWVIADETYTEIARVRAGNGLKGDLHDLELTPRGTALITIYTPVKADLSVVGSFADGEAMDSVIQEIDVESGEVLWEWSSLDHVALAESYAGVPKKTRFPYDYFHINSIEEDPDGDLLVSARNTWAIYKIDKQSGEVVWRLGGRRSDFALGPGVRFAWQHDARWQEDGTMTLFDNQATPKVGPESSAVVLDVDEEARTATVKLELTHPAKVLAIAEGNAQGLPGGAMFVGWGLGSRRGVSELGPRGELRFDLVLPGDTDTYRAYRLPWVGRPTDRPAIAATRDGDAVKVYASWNGATEVTHWELLAGHSPGALTRVGIVERSGFETTLELPNTAPWIAVRAFAGTSALATSAPIRTP
jgi:hypothetical protein